MAKKRNQELRISRDLAMELGKLAVTTSKQGWYLNTNKEKRDISVFVQDSLSQKVSIPPDFPLPFNEQRFDQMTIQVSNETTLQASKRLLDTGTNVLALNFANGISPGGGFLHGALAQEECLCRSSALYVTLQGDPMYKHHAARSQPDSTDWAILSPKVPVFRTDEGTILETPYLLSFLTCAAPYAPTIGKQKSAELMNKRIRRILQISKAYRYEALVLGAWGCGAFANDPFTTAQSFKNELFGDFAGAFQQVVFAITDWSPERRLLGPFMDSF